MYFSARKKEIIKITKPGRLDWRKTEIQSSLPVILLNTISVTDIGIANYLQIWDLEFLDQWVRQHADDAKALGKPLLVEEFGKQVFCRLRTTPRMQTRSRLMH